MADQKKRGLGRGLGALISSTAFPTDRPTPPRDAPPVRKDDEGDRVLQLDPRNILPNPKQPRSTFDEEQLGELAESIRVDGVHEPVIVRKKNGQFELVSGERRVRASILADLKTIPAVARDVSDRDMLKLGLIENIQREDLNPIETARAFQALIKEFNWTQEDLAKQVGKKRVTVTNTLRLLNLPADVLEHVKNGALTMGHARALLALDTADKQSRACRTIIKEGLSVRQAEKLASPKAVREPSTPQARDPHVDQIEDELRRKFGTRVTLRINPKNNGKFEIEFFGLDDLDRLLILLRK